MDARCDKVTLSMEMEYDRFATWFSSFKEQCEQIADQYATPVNLSFRCRAHDVSSGLRLYEVDTWGRFSDALLKELPENYHRFLARLDYRVETKVNEANLPRVDLFYRNHGKGGYNANLFSSRERDKKEGRHGGGQGWALGSHKSDQRLVVYKKKSELGAVELNVTGRSLKTMVDMCHSLMAKGAFSSFYDAAMASMAIKMDMQVRKVGFASLTQLADYVADDTAPSDPSLLLTPEMIKTVGREIRSAGKKERGIILAQLGLRHEDFEAWSQYGQSSMSLEGNSDEKEGE